MWADRIANLLMEAHDDGMMVEVESALSGDTFELTIYDDQGYKHNDKDFWVAVEMP